VSRIKRGNNIKLPIVFYSTYSTHYIELESKYDECM